jgi:prophage regulatory protein
MQSNVILANAASPVHPSALLPATGYLRQPQIIGKKPTAKDPGLPALVPVSASTLWAWVKDGRFPAPVKLGPRTTAWRVEDVRAYLEQAAA